MPVKIGEATPEPDIPCPDCGTKLRVQLNQDNPNPAPVMLCTECGLRLRPDGYGVFKRVVDN